MHFLKKFHKKIFSHTDFIKSLAKTAQKRLPKYIYNFQSCAIDAIWVRFSSTFFSELYLICSFRILKKIGLKKNFFLPFFKIAALKQRLNNFIESFGLCF